MFRDKKLHLQRIYQNNMSFIMKSSVFIAASLFFCFTANAQEGTINIEQDPKISTLVEVYKSVNSNTEYYQIQVGFGSYQKALNLKSQVDIDFPGWYSKIEFQEPTYRVRLGKFRKELEAERKFKEVREKYPNAMLLKPENSAK